MSSHQGTHHVGSKREKAGDETQRLTGRDREWYTQYRQGGLITSSHVAAMA